MNPAHDPSDLIDALEKVRAVLSAYRMAMEGVRYPMAPHMEQDFDTACHLVDVADDIVRAALKTEAARG